MARNLPTAYNTSFTRRSFHPVGPNIAYQTRRTFLVLKKAGVGAEPIKKSNAVSAVAIRRYQEPKRACCARTFSPTSTPIGNQQQASRYQPAIRKPRENCDLRKCKHAKSSVENEFCNTHRLLDKIQHLKKSIQDLETVQKCGRRRVQGSSKGRNALTQTEDLTVTDLNSAREVLTNCITEMTKLKAFLDDENCWWRMFKNREFSCCQQKSPHLHGVLDGTMVTLRMLEESLDVRVPLLQRSILSTRSSAYTAFLILVGHHDSQADQRDFHADHSDFHADQTGSLEFSSIRAEFQQKEKSREQYTDTFDDDTIKYMDFPNGSIRTAEFDSSKTTASCQRDCPMSCNFESHNTAIAGSSRDTTDFAIDNTSQFDTDADRISPQDETSAELPNTTSSFAKLPKGIFFTSSSIVLGYDSRTKHTFSSENTASKRILAADVSTSTDLLAILL
ncbi:uncharacterized protein LOC143368850 [Andrena cerasifolii]|uniref:uncharacterized protein LOC143368850 n=1 Tax=Andrena cerasifolii TaxID=2819439 RepID=UPI004037CA33